MGEEINWDVACVVAEDAGVCGIKYDRCGSSDMHVDDRCGFAMVLEVSYSGTVRILATESAARKAVSALAGALALRQAEKG